MQYITVAANQSDYPLGTSGRTSPGDYIEIMSVVVTDPTDCAVSLNDGDVGPISVFPDNPGGGIGVYPVKLHMLSRAGQWTISTSAGCTVIVVGVFL